MAMITVALDWLLDSLKLKKNLRAALAILAPGFDIEISQFFRLAVPGPYLPVTPASLLLSPAQISLKISCKSFKLVS